MTSTPVIQLKGGHTAKDPRLDRLPEFDEKSKEFPIRELVGELPLRSFGWYTPAWLDQGSEGACVGFSWSHELAAYPYTTPDVSNETARSLYRRAQQLDQWPGESYSGTSVLAGAKALKEQGHMDEYRWAFGVEDALRAIGYAGPVVIGVNWYEGMFEPDEHGLIYPTGELMGGHAILVRGVLLKKRFRGLGEVPVVRLHNSWGADWGISGDCYLKIEDFELLLNQGGEVCVPVVRGQENRSVELIAEWEDTGEEEDDAGHDDPFATAPGVRAAVESELDALLQRIARGEEDVPGGVDDEALLAISSERLVTRAEWGARSPKGSSAIYNPKGSGIHWQGPGLGEFSHSRCAHLVRGIQNYHMDTQGWYDIAYSALACPHGYVFEGRGVNKRTAANGTNEGNAGWYAICWLGGEGDKFELESKQAYIRARNWLREAGGAGRDDRPHRSFKATGCPGNQIAEWVDGGMNMPKPPPPAPPNNTFARKHVELRRGSRGGIVTHLQNMLQIETSDLFNGATERAVKRFQSRHNLEPDGIVRDAEWALIHPVLRRGSKRHVVREVQRALGVGETGVFDRETERAVRRFQGDHRGLTVDGIVGPATYRELLRK